MWMMLPGIRKDQVSWQSLQCMLWAGSADPGVCVCVEKGNTWVCSSWSDPAPYRIFPWLYTGERGAGNQVLGPALMMRIYFPLSQAWVVSNVQKGRQCYVWEGQHFQSRIWCNGNYPKLFLLACSKTSSELLHSCVNPLVYPYGVSWILSKLQGLGDAWAKPCEVFSLLWVMARDRQLLWFKQTCETVLMVSAKCTTPQI